MTEDENVCHVVAKAIDTLNKRKEKLSHEIGSIDHSISVLRQTCTHVSAKWVDNGNGGDMVCDFCKARIR